MKALFVKCYGKLTVDMMIGGLIDMGVPIVYLKAKLKDAGLPETFLEKPNPKAQISAHYFHIPPVFSADPLKESRLFGRWKTICEKGNPDWEEKGWKVLSLLTAEGAAVLGKNKEEADFTELKIGEENLTSLYLFLACLDYLDVDGLFAVPFSTKEGKTAEGKASFAILKDAVSTAGVPVDTDGIHPFAAALLQGLAISFTPVDGRFLLDTTGYGSASAEKPAGENTVVEYLGYFTDRGESIFSPHMKVFGTLTDKDY